MQTISSYVEELELIGKDSGEPFINILDIKTFFQSNEIEYIKYADCFYTVNQWLTLLTNLFLDGIDYDGKYLYPYRFIYASSIDYFPPYKETDLYFIRYITKDETNQNRCIEHTYTTDDKNNIFSRLSNDKQLFNYDGFIIYKIAIETEDNTLIYICDYMVLK